MLRQRNRPQKSYLTCQVSLGAHSLTKNARKVSLVNREQFLKNPCVHGAMLEL